MSEPMTKEEAEKIMKAMEYQDSRWRIWVNNYEEFCNHFGYKKADSFRIMKALRLGHMKLRSHIIQHMVGREVVVTGGPDFEHPEIGTWWWNCPNCKSDACIAESDNFCGMCGVKLIWRLGGNDE